MKTIVSPVNANYTSNGPAHGAIARNLYLEEERIQRGRDLDRLRRERNAYRRLATLYVRALMEDTDFPIMDDLDPEESSALRTILRTQRANQAKRAKRGAA